jgi:class 3 adenylate cyclase
MAEIDFEAEGLLEGVRGEAREARLALLRDLAEAGVPVEELRRAVAEDRLALVPVERVFEPGPERYSPRQVAELTGLDLAYLIRLQQALGFPTPRPDEKALTEVDLQGARRAKKFLDAGLPGDALLETSRIIGMTMAQLAASNRDMIGDLFLEPGVDERELALRYAAAGQAMLPLLGETLRYVHDQHLRESLKQAVISNRELTDGRLEGSDQVAIAFADLVDFTRLGERLEIDAIGRLTGRLFERADVVGGTAQRATEMAELDKLDAPFVMLALGLPMSSEMGEAIDNHLDLLHETMQPWAAQGGYFNFAERPAEIEAILPTDTCARLAEVKRRWDPDELIRANHMVSLTPA